MKLIRCISGGQWGSDIAGLAAAHDLGIPTGGVAPKGWKTIYGPNPLLKNLGLVESHSSSYRIRTFENVKISDGTMRFANDFKSPGEICTLNAIKIFKKPHLDFNLNKDLLFDDPEHWLYNVDTALEWLNDYGIKIINIAGNAGKDKMVSRHIFIVVRKFLKVVFSKYNSGGYDAY